MKPKSGYFLKDELKREIFIFQKYCIVSIQTPKIVHVMYQLSRAIGHRRLYINTIILSWKYIPCKSGCRLLSFTARLVDIRKNV